MVKDSHGAGLVLLKRSEWAFQAMPAFEPNLYRSMGNINNNKDAYSVGQDAGSQFSGGRSALGFKNRRLEKALKQLIALIRAAPIALHPVVRVSIRQDSPSNGFYFEQDVSLNRWMER